MHRGPLNKRAMIFHYNSHISWWIFTVYVPTETGMNILQNGYKIYNFTLTVSSTVAMVSAVHDDGGRLLPAMCSIELVVCNYH